MSKQCPYCYTLNDEGNGFCINCGMNLNGDQNINQQGFNQQQMNRPVKKSNDSFIWIIIIILCFFAISSISAFLLFII